MLTSPNNVTENIAKYKNNIKILKILHNFFVKLFRTLIDQSTNLKISQTRKSFLE